MENNVKDCSVAINYTINGELQNDKYVPLLFSWEDKSKTVEKYLIEDQSLWDWIESKGGLSNLNAYIEGKLSWYEYVQNESRELEYKEYSKLLYELRPIKNYDVHQLMISHFLYIEICNLYKKCFSESFDCNEYKNSDGSYDFVSIIYKMYSNMKDKYKEKLTTNTIKESVRAHIQEKNIYPSIIIDSLVDFLGEILETK